MNANVLLVHPANGQATGHGNFHPGAEFPIGLAYLASFVEQQGTPCDILDLRLPAHRESTLVRYLKERQPMAVGITASTAAISKADAIAKLVKELSPSSRTVIGGWHASTVPELTLKQYRNFDFVVHGEGERAFAALIRTFVDGSSPLNCQGIAYREDGHIVVNPPAPLISNLDELPPPARHKLPIASYRPAARARMTLPATGIMVGRGCPHHCFFCCKGVWGSTVRVRSPESVFAEILACVEQYGIRDFRFYDDDLRGWQIERLCYLLVGDHVNIHWSCSSRMVEVDGHKLKAMKEAGCYQIELGIASGTGNTEGRAEQLATQADAQKVIELCRRAGIECAGTFILGMPPEKKEESAQTRDLAVRLSPDFASFHAFHPVPGSPYTQDLAPQATDPSCDFVERVESESIANQAYRAFYRRPAFFWQRLKSMRLRPERELHIVADSSAALLANWYEQRRSTPVTPQIATDPWLWEWIRALVERCTRAASWCTALLCLVITSPVVGLIALAIKLDSPGPALFRQIRVGRNRRNQEFEKTAVTGTNRRDSDLGGRPFVFYKFRTMYVDARQRFSELYRYSYSDQEIEKLYFKLPVDPRLTRLGVRLRKSTLDELPNLINVLTGDMNLVGPRPDIPEMVKYYKDWQKKKFRVKPGITGLAQVSGRGLLSFQQTLQADVAYVENRSLWLDLKIVLKTLKVTLFKIGAF